MISHDRGCEPEGVSPRGSSGTNSSLQRCWIGKHAEGCLRVHWWWYAQLTTTILDVVQQAGNYKQLRKGANEGLARSLIYYILKAQFSFHDLRRQINFLRRS